MLLRQKISVTDSLFTRFNIAYYPSFRLIRNGEIAKRQFEGRTTVEALFDYVKQELEDPVKEFQDIDDLGILDVSCKHE